MADRQPQAHAGLIAPLFGGEIGIKYFRQLILGDAGPLVGEGDPHVAARLQGLVHFLESSDAIDRPQ